MRRSILPVLLPLAPLALALAACDKGPGTSISINAAGEDGNALTARIDNSGDVAVQSPLFSGTLKLPAMKLDAGDFDMNGVHLYPGSTIGGINIDTQGRSNGRVRVSFASPAAPVTVRDWFQGRLNAAGYRVTAEGSNLVGTTDENKPFRLQLTPAGEGKANGSILIG